MKKLIIGCAALASALALNAAVESGNTFGILKVVSNQEQVIISVPWVTVGSSSSGTTISPTDLVCTTGLSEGDYMLYYHNGNYSSWVINSSGAWEADDVLEGTIGTKASDGLTVTRGTDAIILVRTGDLTSTSAFYLNGQYKAEAGETTINYGTTTQVTFFAPTTAGDVYLNKNASGTPVANDDIVKAGSGSPANGDIIRFAGDKKFTYKNGRWEYTRNEKVTETDPVMGQITVYNPVTTYGVEDVVLPAGVAAIYTSVPRESAGSIVYQWKKLNLGN